MKVKRKLGAFVCCLAVVMGMFSLNTMQTQAALCSHTLFRVTDEDCQNTYNTIEGHYETRGMKHQCADCGYTYWTNLHEVKTGNHSWQWKEKDDKTGWDYYCSGCGSYKGDF